jgi:hypothetical protein
MTAAVLQNLHKPRMGEDSITLDLVTQTPLYTGGIGQWGDQIHPSGLLGSIRFFSCLVARTLGDTGFEDAVWGNAGGDNHHARGVALRWDVTGLKLTQLPEKLEFQREDIARKRAWYYNQAYTGRLKLTVTRRNISDNHWNLLLLALRIQIRHGTFGAKDQFGLGVLSADHLPSVTALNEQIKYPIAPGSYLYGCCFGLVKLGRKPGNREELDIRQALRLGLTARIAMRDALRPNSDAPPAEQQHWKAIRHRMLGSLNEYGSAVNISAAYPLEDSSCSEAMRFMIRIPRTSEELSNKQGNERIEILKRLFGAFEKLVPDGWNIHGITREFGGNCGGFNHPAKWLNKLAGI